MRPTSAAGGSSASAVEQASEVQLYAYFSTDAASETGLLSLLLLLSAMVCAKQ